MTFLSYFTGAGAEGAHRSREPISLKSMSRAAVIAGAAAFWLGGAGQALALPDVIYPNGATWTVNSVLDTNVTNSFAVAADGATTLNTDVFDGDAVVVATTWAIQRNSSLPGARTAYPRTVTFTAATVVKPVGASNVAVAAIADCIVTSANSTCARDISFPAPSVAGGYSVEITLNTGSGAGPLQHRKLTINFEVIDIEDIDTKIVVDNQCFLLNSGDQDLTATLTEDISGDPVLGEYLDFSINPAPGDLGSAMTDSYGVATLTYDINGLPVGDHTLHVEFEGNPPYNGSISSGNIGVSYLFAGFGEPINGDGTSIFGGRVIPVKIRLLDANGDPVSDASPTVWIGAMDGVASIGTTLEAATSVSAADTGNTMRFVPEDGHYIYNFDAMALPNGVYKIVVQLGDSPTCRAEDPSVMITVARKGGKK